MSFTVKALRNILFAGILITAAAPCVFAAFNVPMTESRAYQRYQQRNANELSRLIYLMDRFNFQGMEIKIDGAVYQAPSCLPYAKAYLALYYRGEKAEDWIQKHCYRSPFTNDVMLGRLPGEKFRPGRDLLLEELARLRAFESGKPAA